jgi:hypothetical protein
MQIDYGENGENTEKSSETVETTTPGTKIGMMDALKKIKGDDPDLLDRLNRESEAAMGGTLFERVTVPVNNP